MTYSIEKLETGAYAIMFGTEVIRADLLTNADAWRALDRLEGDSISPAEARSSWGFRRAALEAPYARPVSGAAETTQKIDRQPPPRKRATNANKRHPMVTRSNKRR